jgi:sigma-B regulation protein RsbU (phosphoserine phosphatase)
MLLLFSDGIVEARPPDSEEMFGEERIVQSALKHRDRPAAEVVRAILDEVLAFQKSELSDDDMTLVVVKAV